MIAANHCNSFSYFTSILKKFKTSLDEEPEDWHSELKTAWPKKVVTYFLHASSCGSLGAVKYFIASRQTEPNIRYIYYGVWVEQRCHMGVYTAYT